MSYQPKTGAACSCKRGVQRDNCPTCEGTGMVIDFRAIHARRLATTDQAHDIERDNCPQCEAGNDAQMCPHMHDGGRLDPMPLDDKGGES